MADFTLHQGGKSKPTVGSGVQQGGGSGDGMEPRVAKLESDVGYIQRDIGEIKQDIREMRKEAKDDFRILFGALIVVAIGLAGLMAKGFQWL
jgi:hypothetical protein